MAIKKIKKTRINRKSKKTIAQLRSKLWDLLSIEIKKRDGNTCVSCGRTGLIGSNFHAGHLFSAGGHSNTRYHPLNIHSQDFRCNISLRGNAAEYSKWFIEKYGMKFFSKMYDASRKEKKWTSIELEELISKIKLGLDHYSEYYQAKYGPDLIDVLKK